MDEFGTSERSPRSDKDRAAGLGSIYDPRRGAHGIVEPRTDRVARGSSGAHRATAEVKTVLPTDLIVRLHSHKLLTGASIGATVTLALGRFFERVDMERAGPRAPAKVAPRAEDGDRPAMSASVAALPERRRGA
ncbi:MAG: hypothetical protein ACYDCK_01065 [Thermoplasmatota archaeon]